MHVRSEPYVICKVPTHVVRIVVDDDLISSPVPVPGIGEVVRRDREIESPEPESIGTAACESPLVSWAETSRETPVLPRMIEVIVRIVATAIVPDPCVVCVDVRRVGMPGLISVGPISQARVLGYPVVRLRILRGATLGGLVLLCVVVPTRAVVLALVVWAGAPVSRV
jgi:hypothetical protein